ncbi:MAG TPA: hypothetical protein PL081_07165, partial [Pseudomonadales bacterium]|nr:hypothetical protein [Pseudomonadales bacterium]
MNAKGRIAEQQQMQCCRQGFGRFMGDIDGGDIRALALCASGSAIPAGPACQGKDLDQDSDVDQDDFGILQRC